MNYVYYRLTYIHLYKCIHKANINVIHYKIIFIMYIAWLYINVYIN